MNESYSDSCFLQKKISLKFKELGLFFFSCSSHTKVKKLEIMSQKPLFRSEALILSTTPYGEGHAILNVFTKDRGVLPFFVQNALKKRSAPFFQDPLSHVEILYQEGQGDFFKGRETSIINLFLEMRSNYEALMTAFDIAGVVLSSQMPEKPAPLLFDLAICYLERLTSMKDPWILSASFRLKTLLLEGLFKIAPTCTLCETALNKSYLQEGMLLCSHCKEETQCFSLNEEDRELLLKLAHCKNFKEIDTLHLPLHFKKMTNSFFQERISC
ncbi:DNA repair protein RecO [Criblamydia sequanensis]|uniref:DNA repair protein RecO n=1 Tax=Candidatus Criblamydia sequanensis CRIB-18 TaxID=1437425 RepID=A0A090CXS5_9BACT|nr:DNA repair protein RecO [Criblamydia sequanensis]CDR32967.1 DNA repair protein RecO [Criblamydia sequanensis CRIB-18]